MVLSPEELARIEEELRRASRPRAAAIDALRIVQQHRGFLSDEALADLASHLSLPLAELEGLATFYNFLYRRPVGRHLIHVCDSASCWLMGAGAVVKEISSLLSVALGGTTPDGRFTLLPNACLGACDHAPTLLVDRDLHLDVKPSSVREILGRYS